MLQFISKFDPFGNADREGMAKNAARPIILAWQVVSHRTFRPTLREWCHVGQAATSEMLAWQTSCATPNFMVLQY